MRHTFNLRGIVDYNLREPFLTELASKLVDNNVFAGRDRSDWLEMPAEKIGGQRIVGSQIVGSQIVGSKFNLVSIQSSTIQVTALPDPESVAGEVSGSSL